MIASPAARNNKKEINILHDTCIAGSIQINSVNANDLYDSSEDFELIKLKIGTMMLMFTTEPCEKFNLNSNDK